jgi:hypothetical protein
MFSLKHAHKSFNQATNKQAVKANATVFVLHVRCKQHKQANKETNKQTTQTNKANARTFGMWFGRSLVGWLWLLGCLVWLLGWLVLLARFVVFGGSVGAS